MKLSCVRWFGVALFIMVTLWSVRANAQTFDEWFKQRTTQHRYLLKQIAGLQLYIQLAREGYTIVNDGLRLVSDIKNGEFSLHRQYFHSLPRVNPAIRAAFKYAGPCRHEVELLLQNDYYQLTDDERISRIREVIKNCNR